MMQRILTTCWCFVLLGFAGISAQVQHPFLLVSTSEYSALQARAASAPWSSMKADAISTINSQTYSGVNYSQMTTITSAGALAYILDPANRASYKTKLYNTMMQWDGITASLNGNDNGTVVAPRTAFFNSVIALDIIYNDLTPAERTNLETKLGAAGNWYWTHYTSWSLNLYGCRGIWALYKGDRLKIDSAKKDYHHDVHEYCLTPDGVWKSAPGYIPIRMTGDRHAKAHFIDILEHTGEDRSYYNNPQLAAFFEWFCGWENSPFKKFFSFGDTAPSSGGAGSGPRVAASADRSGVEPLRSAVPRRLLLALAVPPRHGELAGVLDEVPGAPPLPACRHEPFDETLGLN